MGTFFAATLLTLISLSHLCKPQRLTMNAKPSRDEYLNIDVQWGTGTTQSFSVAVDTTDHTSWVYNGSANTDQKKFNPSQSPTFILIGTKETFSYQNQTTEIEFATDTLTIANVQIPDTEFAVATDSFSITDNETLSGFLCLDRVSTIVPKLYAQKSINNATISIDVANEKLYFGSYKPSTATVNNVSNATDCSDTRNDYLKETWTFDIKVLIDDTPALGSETFKGVIDSASPYITIYAKTETLFLSLWQLIDKTNNVNEFNCNYTTRVCDHANEIMNYMTIQMPTIGWNASFFREDFVKGNMIQFFWDNDTDYTTDGDASFVLFLGRPFLKRVLVSMNYTDETLTFYSLKATTTPLNWVPIVIVFAAVVAFSGLFFGIYYWKFGKIPPPSNHDVEEQSHSLLRGPAVQAVGTSQGNIQQPPSSAFSGVSGLDDDDDELQRQIQQAQRLSAIESQQQREQQMRVDRERQDQIQMDEQKQQEQFQQAESKKQQRIGSSSGAAKPSDANDLRQRRLKFLEEQQKKQQDEQ